MNHKKRPPTPKRNGRYLNTQYDKLSYLLSNQPTRVELCKNRFRYFVLYYWARHLKFPRLATYHYDWFKAVDKQLNIFVEWHRESAKTTILGMLYECRLICYKKKSFIINLCYDKWDAKNFNWKILNEFRLNSRIINDFGLLYDTSRTDKTSHIKETSVAEFITTNWIKVKAFGLGEAVRWELYNTKKRWAVRPDFILIDDIDNIRNTKNTRIIAEDMEFIKQEVFGWMDASYQAVWIGNIIRQDWRCVRHKLNIAENDNRALFSNFIYWEAGKTSWTIVRDRYVETEYEADLANARHEWKHISLEFLRWEQASWFKQNYLGIPMIVWDTLFAPDDLKKVYVIDRDKVLKVRIWVDPSLSKKTWADPFGISIVLHSEELNKVVYAWYKLLWEQKKLDRVTAFIKALYKQYKGKFDTRVVIESNNWGNIYWEELQWEGIPTDIVRTSRDKLTNVKEHESDILNWNVKFYAKWTWIDDILLQFMTFTWEDWNEDDLVDATVRWLSDESGTTSFNFI